MGIGVGIGVDIGVGIGGCIAACPSAAGLGEVGKGVWDSRIGRDGGEWDPGVLASVGALRALL